MLLPTALDSSPTASTNYELTFTSNPTENELLEKFTAAFYQTQTTIPTNFDLSVTSSDNFNFEPIINSASELDEEVQEITETSIDHTPSFTYWLEDTPIDYLTPPTSSIISSESNENTTSPFFNPLPFITNDDLHLDFSDIDLCETLSNESFDIDHLADELQSYDEELPPLRTTPDFTNFLRGALPTSLDPIQELTSGHSSYGHLITSNVNNNEEAPPIYYTTTDNLLVLHQSDALLRDDPLLSSGNGIYHVEESTRDSDGSGECETPPTRSLQCRWHNCFQIYESQSALVRHIEKSHVEVRRGDEFTCYWLDCPRQTKPFNARYKLLIHMRVHSGEKPNKCPFKGCNKAFSRLENLKIHQRSHTGERPYLCQFFNCSKSFSNSSDRAKHQRTHFDTKPYACQVIGCSKKYTDPSSLRKHIKNHSYAQQLQLKTQRIEPPPPPPQPTERRAIYRTDHNYTVTSAVRRCEDTPSSLSIRQDLKNKISEKWQRRIESR